MPLGRRLMVKPAPEMPDAEELISQGEGRSLDFKLSPRHDFKSGAVNKTVIRIGVKTVARFVNIDGGRLIIGVDESGTVLRLEPDLATLRTQNLDGFEFALRAALNGYPSADGDAETSNDHAEPFLVAARSDHRIADVAVIHSTGADAANAITTVALAHSFVREIKIRGLGSVPAMSLRGQYDGD